MKAIGFAMAAFLGLSLGVSGYADEAAVQVPEGGSEAAHVDVEAAPKDVEAQEDVEAAQAKMEDAVKLWADTVNRNRRQAQDNQAFLGVLIARQSEAGIDVAGVTPDGGAEAAGLQAEDIIVAIDGEPLTGHNRPMQVLRKVLRNVAPGDGVSLVISRDGDEQPFEVVTTSYDADAGLHAEVRKTISGLVGERPGPPVDDLTGMFGPSLQPGRFLFDTPDGLRLVDIGEDIGDYFGVDGGVLVLNTPAKSELKPGDIVRRIDDADVASAAEAYRLLWRAEGDAEVEVRRKNRTVTATVAQMPPRATRIQIRPAGRPGPAGQVRPAGKVRPASKVRPAGKVVELEVEKIDAN